MLNPSPVWFAEHVGANKPAQKVIAHGWDGPI